MHVPVLLNEVLDHLQPRDGETYVDATFGAGGYTKAILNSADCKVFAIDRDLNAINLANKVKEEYKDRFEFLRGNFSQVKDLLAAKNVDQIDGIVFDLGVSSMQFDEMERGFSFDSDAKLDMRMDQESSLSAYEVVNELEEVELANMIRDFSDEKFAKRIARKIVNIRRSKPITSCRELADVVRSCYGPKFQKIDPATRTFQAIRIYVNQELTEIANALQEVKQILSKDSRLIVVSFHSLEDAIVKNFLKKEAGIDKSFSRYEPVTASKEASFKIVNKSAIKPSEDEVSRNYRARSSKMRVAIKL